MNPRTRLLIIFLSFAFAQSLAAQAYIDMTMQNIPVNSNKLEVRLRTTDLVTNGLYSSGVFTVRYPTALGGTLSVFSQVYNYTIAGMPANSGGFTYYRFQFATNYTVNWNACEEYIAVTLQYSGGPANGAFELITGVPWTNQNNGEYYQELDGQERQGVFYNYKTSVTNVACNGGSTGAIDLSITGGRPAFTYAWSNNQTTQDISNLAAGTYTVSITDNSGCTSTIVSTVSAPAALAPSIGSVTPASCGSSNGAIDLNVSGGTMPYSYDWSNNGPQNPDSDPQDLSGLSAGTYTVTVTDANACSATISASVSSSSGLSLSAVVTNNTCGGGNNGAIDLTVTGGATPYSYDWSNNGPQDPDSDPQDLMSLPAGTYTVTVTDASSCSATLSTVVAGNTLVLNLAAQNNVSCSDGANGSVTVGVSGGTAPYTYDWTGTPVGDGSASISGLTAGTYTVTVTDASSCSATISAIITAPAALLLSETHVNVLCNGNATGSIDLSVSGGVSPYTYNWGSGITTQDRSNLAAGTYTVTVTDANACTKSLTTSITAPVALLLTETHVNVLCNGNATGSIDLSVSGGVNPYTYNWGSGITTQDRSGLAAGTYTVTVTDANACTKSLTASISQPTAVVLTETHVNVLCNGNATGSIDLSVSGGTAGYTYNWGGGVSTQDRTNLAAGTYTVIVTDANSCTKSLTASITEPGAILLTETHQNVLCNGNATGSIDLSVSGGTGGYTYNWGAGITTQDRTNLAAGTYTVTVTDGNSCIKTLSATLTEPTALALSTTTSNSSCGNANGSIDLTVSGGTGAYTYNWGGGITTQDRSNLAAGTYTVIVSDANACSKTISATVNNTNGPSLSATQVNVLCNGNATGSIDLSVSGGTSPYTYSWLGGVTTQDRTNLAAGTYSVTVTDANVCTQILSATITQPTALSLTATTGNATCGNANGSIDLTVSGGTAAYTYNWGGGVTTQDRSNILAGTYTVTVTDANNCIKTLSATVNNTNGPTLTSTQVNILCNGNNTGSIDLTVNGGTGPFTYSWTGGVTTQDRTGLIAGTYSVTVTDNAACTATLAITLTQPLALALTSTQINVLCNGNANGSIDLSVSGGNGAYTYNWGGGISTQDRTNLPAGTYNVTVTDANACSKTLSATITAPAVLLLTETHFNVLCNGAATGSIDLSVSGGTSPYAYNWGGGITTEDRSDLLSGTYTVTVTDANACTKTISASISSPSALFLIATQVNVLCNGNATGSINLSVSSGTSPYTYNWGGGISTQDRSNLAAGTYTVTVTDANACTKTLSATLTEPGALTLSVTTGNASCGNSNGSIDLSVSSGTSPYTYNWGSGITTQDRTNLSIGTYTVTVTDANVCSKTISATITNTNGPTLSATQVDVLCNGNSTGSIDLSISGGTSPYTYLWVGGVTTQDRTNLAAGTYTVTATDANACTQTLSVTITAPAALALSVSSTNSTCGNANGSIDLTVSGGTGAYTYNWAGGVTTQDRTNLSAGTYTVTVTDANACSKTISATVNNTNAPTLLSTQVNVLCNGNATGSIDLSVAGGTSPYTYNWGGGVSTQDRSNLLAGTYTVTVTDANACTKTLSATITEPAVLALSVIAGNATCGNANGTIDLSVSGAVSPFTYNWGGGVTTQDRTNLAAGTYTVVVTDANACSKTISATVNNISGPSLSSTQTNLLCNGGNTGAIDLLVSGGTSPFSYNWGGGITTEDRINLGAGIYTVTVTDANTCTKTLSATITAPTAIFLSATTSNTTCGSSNGTIDLSVSGGTPGYSYNWGGGITSQDRSALSAGIYTVTVSDANACTKTLSATITNTNTPVLSKTQVNILCNGNATGSIDLSVSGGTSPFTYNWGGGITTQDRINLIAGTYTVTVTDNSGCSVTTSATITQPNALLLSLTKVNVLCGGTLTGSIDLSVSGGTPGYTYSWGGGFTTQDRSNLAAGTYTVTVSDANACTKTISATITSPTTMLLSLLAGNTTCGNANGSIDLNASGGVGPYTYNWAGGITTQDRSNLFAGIYTVTVTDANACTKTISATINDTNGPTLTKTQVNVLCNGNATGSINLSVSGGTSPYTYNWGGGITTQDRSNLAAGTYTVTVTAANDCTKTLSVTITSPAALAPTAITLPATCGNNNGSIDLSVSGGTPAYTYNWGGGITTQDRLNLAPGTYTVTVTDANACTKSMVASVGNAGSPSLSSTQQHVLCNGSSTGAIDLSISGGTSPFTYNWTGGVTTQDRSNLAAGTYTVTVTDANNCTKTLSATILAPLAMLLSETHLNVLCNDNANGSIDLSVSGGVGPYQYNWGGGISTQDRTNLSAGTYTVTVTDGNACTQTLSATLTAPAALVLSASTVPSDCGTTNGSIDLSVSGGTSPFTYNWGGGFTTQDRTNLGAGTYTVTVTDGNACTKTLVTSISNINGPVLSATQINLLCNGGASGAIDLSVTGGVSPYTYNWGGGISTQDRSNLAAGTYTVTVTDAGSCTQILSASILAPPALVLTETHNNVICNNNASGSIDLSVSGGTSPYTYNWGGGISTQDRSNLNPGTYTVIVTDANACSQALAVTILYLGGPVLTETHVNNPCPGNTIGAIDLIVSGGTAPYSYNWGAGISTQDRSNLASGTYSVIVTDANSCSQTLSATILTLDNAAPTLTAGIIATCYPTFAAAEAAAIAGTTIQDDFSPIEDLDILVSTTDTCPATVIVTVTDLCGQSNSVTYTGLCIGASSVVNIAPGASSDSSDCATQGTELQAWLDNHGGAVATGSGIVWTHSTPVFVLDCNTHSKSASVTFRATNDCNYFEETTATFKVKDLTPPTANPIPATSLSCNGSIPAPDLNLVTGEADNCGGTPSVALFASSDNMGSGCPASPRIIVHQYVVTDDYCNTALVNQTITLIDNLPPDFTAPANITIEMSAGCTYDASVMITGDVLTESDNCTPTGPGLQAIYTDVVTAVSNQKNKFVITRTWQLTDACGNSAIPRTQTITVQDNTAPSFVSACPPDLTLPGGALEGQCGAYFGIQPELGFSDNCAGASIRYQLTGATVTPNPVNGYVAANVIFKEGLTTVTYTVTDAVGNTAVCSFTVSVNCVTVSGRLIWEHDKTTGVQNGTVTLTPTTPLISDLSDLNGLYELAAPANGMYTIKPVKNINRLNGVNAADATAIKNHVNGSMLITDPYKKVCADVNRTNVITSQDALIITQSIAGYPPALAVFSVYWRFVDASFVWPTPVGNNVVPAFPATIDVNVTGADIVGKDFYGMKIGDVAPVWANPANAPEPSPLVWVVQDQTLVTGTEIELAFTTTNFNDLAAYQFALDFDPALLQFVDFQPLGALPMNLLDNFGAYHADLGELRHVWSAGNGTTLADGTTVFKARFKVLEGGQKLSEVLRLDDSQIECKAFSGTSASSAVRLVFATSVGTEAPGTDPNTPALQLLQNRPNPFSTATTIGFILPESCDTRIRILDLSGRELSLYERKYTAGYHELEFRMENAASYGLLFCELVTPQGRRVIKMVTVR
jgi:hypothetical protein